MYVILQHDFLCDHNELSNESCNVTTQLDILPPLNWLDFCFKALLSSYMQRDVLTLMAVRDVLTLMAVVSDRESS